MDILKDINFVQWLIGILMAYAVWTFRRALTGFEQSIKDLYEKYGKTDTRLTRVETVHNIKGCDTVSKHD
ncbi:MAG: hypothetical protein WC869_15780 [Phycisphaerae bacterium]|jgi:hypothetical protein